MDIHVYTFEDREGNETGSFYTESYAEAKEYAIPAKLRIIDNTYEWQDSDAVDDFTVCAHCNESHDVNDSCDLCDDCGQMPAENCVCCPGCSAIDGDHGDDCVNGEGE